jgi:molybdopterin molybdotransferase
MLSTGGASDGDEDHMSGLLNEADSLAIWRVAVKPGRPIAMGVWNAMPVFGLPGNPVAALVCALIFASPALRVLAGGGWVSPQSFLVPAGFRKTKKPGRVEYLRARIEAGRVVIFPSEGSGRVSGLSWAQGLVELGAGAQEINAGDPVQYIPFSSFGA